MTSVAFKIVRSGPTLQLSVFEFSTVFDVPPAALGACQDTLAVLASGCPPGTEVLKNPQAS